MKDEETQAPTDTGTAGPVPVAATDPAGKTTHVKITLIEPIERTSGPIRELTLRRPKSGELRGLSVEKLFEADTNSVIALIPRISDPYLTEQEAADLSPADFFEIAGMVKGFFFSPALKAAIAKAHGG